MIISAGDPYGIGPEVAVKALNKFLSPSINNTAEIACIWIGPLEALNNVSGSENLDYKLIQNIKEVQAAGLFVIDISAEIEGGYKSSLQGSCNADGGSFAYVALERAISLCLNKEASALITAPISKEAMQLAKSPLLGHTEYLAERAGNADVVMILAQGNLRVALLTVHMPLREVVDGVTQVNMSKIIRVLLHELHSRFSIEQPKIAVLGLNPHAGENGYIGTEELEIISPFIKEYNAQAEYHILSGPFAADGFFGSKHYQQFDAVLAMYHDQGLVGFKSIAFGGGVNITAGLPFVRTSPDHGTAYSIAGKNSADESSMLEALTLAATLSKNL